MAEIPHAVLSEAFADRLNGRRLRAAIFLTYKFDPGFFEQQILPVFLDLPASHVATIRLIQLEDALRGLSGKIAVYYDANGLTLGDSGSARLDASRIPVRHSTGVFHAKNVFLLVEATEVDRDEERPQALLVASLSANLTRAGWWENVEACHIEEIADGGKTRLRDDLVAMLEGLRRRAAAHSNQTPLEEILAFLRKRTVQRERRSSEGQLFPHFYNGKGSLPDFLESVAGDMIAGAYLEVISPYFDEAARSGPLEELLERFHPREVRVFLPESPLGEAICDPKLYESVRGLGGVSWGRFPKEIVRRGPAEEATDRFVHAKLYRFFTQSPKREVIFVGSANLTNAAHQTGGNFESGFLVHFVPGRKPDFWLQSEVRPAKAFAAAPDAGDTATTGGTRLNLRYWWDRRLAEAYWDGPLPSPPLRLELASRDVEAGALPALPPRVWTALDDSFARHLEELLPETSLFKVHGDGEQTGLLLVQEEGMSHKPSLLFTLSASEILQYWALLSPEQRAAFLEARAPAAALLGEGSDLVAHARLVGRVDSMFDRFAGIFHAFACLERDVRRALDEEREAEANYRLFGKKYDSLGNFLERVRSEDGKSDDVDRYVILLCARQLCQEIKRDHPEYWRNHRLDAVEIEGQLSHASEIRARIAEADPTNLSGFLDWFDGWFLRRAQPLAEESA